MNNLTWGLEIPGYSSPSLAQKKLFAKWYPEKVAWHNMETERLEQEKLRRADQIRQAYRKGLKEQDAVRN
jgi:hypothetical protein